ncbi:hypothetical protein [Chitinibacter sp. S2-10]|uniref:hypothetical protein n=1 Tax=Chitinibacter sp. S2-10 TaxID=3373597 RepID=UPI003977DF5C
MNLASLHYIAAIKDAAYFINLLSRDGEQKILISKGGDFYGRLAVIYSAMRGFYSFKADFKFNIGDLERACGLAAKKTKLSELTSTERVLYFAMRLKNYSSIFVLPDFENIKVHPLVEYCSENGAEFLMQVLYDFGLANREEVNKCELPDLFEKAFSKDKLDVGEIRSIDRSVTKNNESVREYLLGLNRIYGDMLVLRVNLYLIDGVNSGKVRMVDVPVAIKCFQAFMVKELKSKKKALFDVYGYVCKLEFDKLGLHFHLILLVPPSLKECAEQHVHQVGAAWNWHVSNNLNTYPFSGGYVQSYRGCESSVFDLLHAADPSFMVTINKICDYVSLQDLLMRYVDGRKVVAVRRKSRPVVGAYMVEEQILKYNKSGNRSIFKGQLPKVVKKVPRASKKHKQAG